MKSKRAARDEVIGELVDISRELAHLNNRVAGCMGMLLNLQPDVARATLSLRDEVLVLWSRTDLSQEEIGECFGHGDRWVRTHIAEAREAGDPRAISQRDRSSTHASRRMSRAPGKDASDRSVEVGLSASQQQSEEESTGQVQVGNEPESTEAVSAGSDAGGEGTPPDPEPPAAPETPATIREIVCQRFTAFNTGEGLASIAGEPEPAPAAPLETAAENDRAEEPAPEPIADSPETVRINGPRGAVEILSQLARSLKRTYDGYPYSLRTLTDDGGWPSIPAFHRALIEATPTLQSVGIDVIFLNKELVRLRGIGG
ncbi:hypothetical protein [Microvirga massiliensis]|uniref:hypothetical protein n=1 Tax=Microvirga massiliensis TaxID=1033741 RepID=UPI00062B6176|nr:hypothetical protein [Microvirga massiliensis]